LDKRRILVIIDSLGEGGAQRIVADIIKACSDVADIDLVALYWFDFEKNYYALLKECCRSITTISKPTRNKFEKALYRSLTQLSMWGIIRKQIELNKYDLIHTHMIMANQLVYPIKKRFPAIPVIGTYHSNFDHQPAWLNRKAAKSLEQHDHVFCDIEAGYRDLKNVFNDPQKLEHLEFSIDESYFSLRSKTPAAARNAIRMKYGLPVNSCILLSIARIDFHDRKIDKFIDAFSVIRKSGNAQDVVLVIVGTGKDLPAAQKLVAVHNLNERVYFLGHSNELHDLYAMSDIYLTVTCWDDIGVAGKQAIAAGLPTFAITMKPSTQGTQRFFIDATDATQLAQEILRFFSNSNKTELSERQSSELIRFCESNDMTERHRHFYRSFTK
jgi:glycosyltransferase involved in cell wall biosynthesis